MKKLTLILLLVPSFVWGDKLILGGVSKHFFEGDNLCGYNEVHPAIGIDSEGWEVGVYKNSLYRESFFIAKSNTPYKWKGLDVGYRLGLATGYDKSVRCPKSNFQFTYKKDDFYNIEGFLPQAQILISKEFNGFTIDLGLAPISTISFKLNL